MIYSTKLALSIALSLCTVTQGYVVQLGAIKGRAGHYEARSTNLTAEEFLRNPGPVEYYTGDSEPKPGLEQRDGPEEPCQGSVRQYYDIIGDGNPHQNYKIAQVANTLISCPGTVATGESHTFGWSFGGGTNPGTGKYDFANLGFTVSETDTKTVTQSFTCDDGMTEICAMHYTAYTAVSVNFRSQQSDCDGVTNDDLGVGTVYLPNANGIGSSIGRGTNFGDRNIIQCRGSAEREVDFYCGPPGGPEWFDTNEYGPWGANYMAQREPPDCAAPIEASKF